MAKCAQYTTRVQASPVVLFPQTRNSPLCLFSPRCINGYGNILLGGDPGLDQHPIQGGVAILLDLLYALETGISSGRVGLQLAVMYAFTYLKAKKYLQSNVLNMGTKGKEPMVWTQYKGVCISYSQTCLMQTPKKRDIAKYSQYTTLQVPVLQSNILNIDSKGVHIIECFHMTSRRPYWCPKTMKW